MLERLVIALNIPSNDIFRRDNNTDCRKQELIKYFSVCETKELEVLLATYNLLKRVSDTGEDAFGILFRIINELTKIKEKS